MFCIEIIAIIILILFLSKHSLCPRIPEQGSLLFQDTENVLYRTNIRIRIAIISMQTFSLSYNNKTGLLLFQDKDNVLYRNNSNPYSDISSIQTFSFPRIPEQGSLLFQDTENVLYRNNSNPYSDISSIQTFSLSQNNSNPCSIILGQRECFVQK